MSSDPVMKIRTIPRWETLTVEEVRSIASDERSVRSIARERNLPRTIVMAIRAGRRWPQPWLSQNDDVFTEMEEDPDDG